MKRWIKLIGLFFVSVVVLVGCASESEEQAKLLIENFEILDDYDYDKIKVVVEEEKTPQELAFDILAEQMGLNVTPKEEYDEFGLSTSNGIFVNAAILEGPEIPKEPGFDKNAALTAQSKNQNIDNTVMSKFDNIQASRQAAVNNYDINDEQLNIASLIEQRVVKQEEEIAYQREQRRLQDEIFGTPSFEVIENIESNTSTD